MHDNARASGAHTLCLAITQAAMEHVRRGTIVRIKKKNMLYHQQDRRFLLQHTNKLKVNAGLRYVCIRSEFKNTVKLQSREFIFHLVCLDLNHVYM